MRLVKFLSYIVMSKEQRRFMPYLHDCHLDYLILKDQRKKFVNTIKKQQQNLNDSEIMPQAHHDEEEAEKLKNLDINSIYKNCDMDKVNKTIIRNLIDPD